MLAFTSLFANNGQDKKAPKKQAKATPKTEQVNKAVESNATPVVTYKAHRVERKSSKQVVPVQ
jgi:hypothetical protein